MKKICISFILLGSLYQWGISQPYTHQSTVLDSLVAYYTFNGNADDMSGNGNHGIVNGAVLTEDRY